MEVTSSSATGQKAAWHANTLRYWYHRKNLAALHFLLHERPRIFRSGGSSGQYLPLGSILALESRMGGKSLTVRDPFGIIMATVFTTPSAQAMRNPVSHLLYLGE